MRQFLCLALEQTSLFPEEVDKTDQSYGLRTVNTLQCPDGHEASHL